MSSSTTLPSQQNPSKSLLQVTRRTTHYRLHVTIPLVIVVLTVLLVLINYLLNLSMPVKSQTVNLVLWIALALVTLLGVYYCGKALMRLPKAGLPITGRNNSTSEKFKGKGWSWATRIRSSMPQLSGVRKMTPNGLVAAIVFGMGIVGVSAYSSLHIITTNSVPHIALPISAIVLACFIVVSVLDTYYRVKVAKNRNSRKHQDVSQVNSARDDGIDSLTDHEVDSLMSTDQDDGDLTGSEDDV